VVSKSAVLFCMGLMLWGCTEVRTTSPTRSAEEELLISTAADKAAHELAAQLPPNISAFIDSSHFVAEDSPYAIAAIDDQLLRRGIRLTDDRVHADTIIELRAGALSTDEKSTLLGLPPLSLPFVPIGNFVTIPGLPLLHHGEATGVAKFAATVYNPKTGRLVVSTDPQMGFARESDWVVLFVFAWSNRDPALMNASSPPHG
jgi:hypothetical protein